MLEKENPLKDKGDSKQNLIPENIVNIRKWFKRTVIFHDFWKKGQRVTLMAFQSFVVPHNIKIIADLVVFVSWFDLHQRAYTCSEKYFAVQCPRRNQKLP